MSAGNPFILGSNPRVGLPLDDGFFHVVGFCTLVSVLYCFVVVIRNDSIINQPKNFSLRLKCFAVLSCQFGYFTTMSHLRFKRAILSLNLIVRQSCNMQLCMSHTATLSHKEEFANQRSPNSRHKAANNTALL